MLAGVSIVGQAEPDVPGWVTNISDLGIVIFLIVVFFGGLREKPWWVSGGSHRAAIAAEAVRTAAAEKDRDYYREGLLRALGASQQAVQTTKTLADHSFGGADTSDDALLTEVR